MVSPSAAYWIALLPLIAAFVILAFGRYLPLRGAWIGIAAVAASLVMSIDLYWQLLDGTLKAGYELMLPWFTAGFYPIEWGVLLDGPSVIMLLVVSVVSLLVQVYSLGYMHDSPRFKRFYFYLSLFTFSMLSLVLANNYVQFFMCWELMGACSYFLISFEYEREAAGYAGNKAFITTRVGDIALYAGLLTIFFAFQTFNFAQIHQHVADGMIGTRMATWIALLIFGGAVGKSAQVPLHTWLPDAMEGPTPVSALIHSATMVAAGVYLVARSYSFFTVSTPAIETVAWTGTITALLAALMALAADDIKRVLAYSTISQLGYMMIGMGVLGYGASLFHLTTHAAFKALLFLAAGSVIHAVHTNNMWKMGSLSKQMLTTGLAFFCGFLALVGLVPIFSSAFYSKEMILSAAWAAHQNVIFGLGAFTAFLTAVYMGRAFALTFLGEPRERDRFAHAHESGWSMTIPMMALMPLALLLGFAMHYNGTVEHWLSWSGSNAAPTPVSVEQRWIPYLPLAAAWLGSVVAMSLYAGRLDRARRIAQAFRPIHTLFARRFFFDELYDLAIVRPVWALSRVCEWFDGVVIDRGIVDGVGRLTWFLSAIRRWFEETPGQDVDVERPIIETVDTKFVQTYLLIIVLGFVALVSWKLLLKR